MSGYVIQDENHWLDCLFSCRHAPIHYSLHSLRCQRFRYRRLRHHVFHFTNDQYRWDLLPVNSEGTLQGYKKETQNNPCNCILLIDHTDYRNSLSSSYKGSSIPIHSNPIVCLLLVHNKLYPFWPKDSKEAMRVLPDMIY